MAAKKRGWRKGRVFGLLYVDDIFWADSTVNGKNKKRQMAKCTCSCGGKTTVRSDTLIGRSLA